MAAAQKPKGKTDAYVNAQSYEQVMKDPSLALSTMRVYYEKGEKVALLHAFHILCDIWGKFSGSSPTEKKYLEMKIPVWVLDGIKHEIKHSILKGKKLGKGAKANTVARTRANQRHLARFLAVKDALREADECGYKITLNQAAKTAQKRLEQIGASTTQRTIINSHATVERELEDPEQFWKYYPIPNFLGNFLGSEIAGKKHA